VQVLQPGYLMHDRLLRPAMVGVAKAEGKPGTDGPRIDEVV
jgi:molecular chaperone GrpE